MTKLELIAASLAQMCNHSSKCFWVGSMCPFDETHCGITIEQWMKFLEDEEVNDVNDEIIQRLDRIESLLLRQAERQEDPKSLGLFVEDRIKRAAHR